MRVGIVTFTYGDNYGQRLQNYAAQEILKEYADEVFTIPQLMPKQTFLRSAKKYLKEIYKGTHRALQRRKRTFRLFDEQYIDYYQYPVVNSQLKGEKTFSYFVAGSDQIWSPYSADVNESMFLNFTAPDKRIALSPSIAASEIPDDQKSKYAQNWTAFAHLSVREHRGASLIQKLTGKSAEVLIDPTMMLPAQKWKMIMKKPEQELPDRYAVFYYLGSDPVVEDVKKYCCDRQITIINLMGDPQYLKTGPSEFLYLIANADLVVTDSFHGTIFSIIFETPFLICERRGSKIDMSSRFQTLYSTFGISDRKLEHFSTAQIEQIDFTSLHEKIIIEQRKVRAYLEKCFCGE